MRILQWSDGFAPQIGGIETVVSSLSRMLKERGHAVAVLSCDGALHRPAYEEIDGIDVHRLPLREALEQNNLPMIIKLSQAVSQLKRDFAPDIVHLHFRDATCFFHVNTLRAAPCPTLVTIHGELHRDVSEAGSLFRSLCAKADAISTVSRALLDELLDIVPEAEGKSSVIYNGHAPLPATPETSRTGPIFAYGRHVPEKGLDVLMEAFALVAAKRADAIMVLAGDGPLRQELERQAERLRISAQVRFTGYLPDAALDENLRTASMVVVPSRWREGFGMVALEAALRGCPVVATRRGGLPEIVEDNVTGLLVDSEDPVGLAQAILRLTDDNELALRLGCQARETAEQRFNLTRQIEAYQNLYRQLVQQTSPGVS